MERNREVSWAGWCWSGVSKSQIWNLHHHQDYVPIYKSWQPFFTEYIYRRVSDIFGQPITGNPGGIVRVLERRSTDHNRSFSLTGRSFDCINLASYDYLGFSKYTNQESIEDSIRTFGVGVAPMGELGEFVILN